MRVSTRQHVSMLSEEVANKLKQFHNHSRFADVKCLMKNDDHGPRGVNPPVISSAPFDRSRVYTGTRETGSYNHHSQIAKFKGRYCFAFSNGRVDEEADGQRIMISSSGDGRNWSKAACVVGGESETKLVHNCVALSTDEEAMYIVDWNEKAVRDADVVGMRRIIADSVRLDILKSTDGADWQYIRSLEDGLKCIFEAPRLTAEGKLLCACATKDYGPGILLWPGSDICDDAQMIPLKQTEGTVFPHGQGSWYQTDDGRIIMFWRDEGASCRLHVTYSDDGGRTFTPPMVSDIPNSMVRAYAGRLPNGQYYLCTNASYTFLDRSYLTLLVGDSGDAFNKVYMLVDDPTSQRLKGLLKTDGYQYPCCLPDGDKLLVGYSVNKEDIECGVIDSRGL